MTQAGVGFPIDIGGEDPRSQTRDLGHPICYLVIFPSTCHRQVEVLGMTKGERKTMAGPRGAGFGGWEAPSGTSKISIVGVLRLRAIKGCVT
jgi:hypothetical protein